MSKRKLTRRQAWRIEKIQKERQDRAARKQGDWETAPIDENTLGPEREGLVVTHYGTLVLIEADGERRRCHFRSNLGSLVTGDQVVWRDGNPYGVVEAVMPRHSALCRPDPYGDLKTVAANIDQALIVIAPKPEPHFSLVDRYLIAIEASDITPALVINKCDVIDATVLDKIDEIQALYTRLGYRVLRVSATTGEGMTALAEQLRESTSVFVGQSGVGKSSLASYLLPDQDLKVGRLSERETGSHTTTNTELFHFPGGGRLIDSPGVREFGLWHMSRDEVLENFIEFRPFLGRCKFRDCAHEGEPGCAIREAEENGAISVRRAASCRQILESLAGPR
ncbi:small ribosomal subunit biogenesis GTPase RsgA [Marinimicrobium sp. ARAG 43.8]|uniref:small ribosomal subunit biogenesis GTPase RsgA n=1 Tax=Marinimicrobium sp. ARAG 43.8 TaxID=3418719 RepID=UPI003CF8E90A